MKSVIFGIGNDYEKNKMFIQDDIVAYIDNYNYGQIMPDGKKVVPLKEIVNYEFDRIIISSTKYKYEMIDEIKNISEEYIFKTILITELDKRNAIINILKKANDSIVLKEKKNEKSNKKYYIVIPAGVVTGGPELLHQLAYSIKRRNRNIDVNIVYYHDNMSYSDNMEKLVPKEYKDYVNECRIINRFDIEDESGNIVIIPEVLSDFGMSIKNAFIYFWWLSVDNFINSINDFNILEFLMNVDYHLYQSEYARRFIVDLGISKDRIIELSDYINDDYTLMDYCKKENIIAYNPKKGFNYSLGLKELISEYEFIPIQNMNRYEVKELLQRSKIYIDFGNHPGKDRLPREAVLMNCCVICARRGSADNEIDVSIDNKYKIDINKKMWCLEAKKIIVSCIEDYDSNIVNFKSYKDKTLEEKKIFEKQVDILLDL